MLTALAEILITFLPGGYTTAETVTDWFALLQNNPFLGLRNLGLLNIVMIALGIPMIFTLYWIHRKVNQPFAALAMILSFIGVAVFYATNRAFPMLDLSAQYAAATSEAQRTMLEAAGQAMLSVGQSHTPGTFLAFFFSEIAGILMAVVILRGKLFNPVAAVAGIVGYGFLLIFEILSSFVPSSHNVILILAMIGGLANIAWYILVALGLFRLGKVESGGCEMNKVVLITGCSSGIGRDLAQRLAQAGYTVVATARNVKSIESLDADLKLSLDVTQAESIQTAVEATLQKFGRIDVLINNAGYAQVGAIEELSDEQIQQMYDVNVFGVMRMVRAVVPYMRKQNAGQIINISSIAGKVVTPVNGAYSSTKFALEAISDALRLELEPFNIQVILIEPGAIKTHFDQTVHALWRCDHLKSSITVPLALQKVPAGIRWNARAGTRTRSSIGCDPARAGVRKTESALPGRHGLAGKAGSLFAGFSLGNCRQADV